MGNVVAVTLRRTLRLGFGLVGSVFLVVALVQIWSSSRGAVLPDWPNWAIAAVFVGAGLYVAGRSWLALFGDRPTGGLLEGFYVGQLGKYIPGGIWQAVGQIGLTASAAGSAARATAGFTVHGVIQLVAGAVVAALAGVAGLSLPGWARILAILGIGSVVLLDRRWMVRVARLLTRRFATTESELVPSQRAILVSFAWIVPTVLAASAAFALLLMATSDQDSFTTALLAFALAWTAGYLAVPFPSGLGVREVVLIGSLSAGAAPIIAASLAHRLVTIGAEIVLILSVRRRSP